MKLKQTYLPLDGLMSQVEAAIQSAQLGLAHGLEAAAPNLAAARGRRVPALLLLMAAECAGGAGPRSLSMATVVELIHAASLIHEAVSDDTGPRNQRPSAEPSRRNPVSVLLGDYLLASAFGILAADGNMMFLAELMRVIARMCEGQVHLLRARGDFIPEAQYLDRLRERTGSLLGFCGRTGVLTAGGTQEWADALDAFGERFGVAFHVTCEILDLTDSSLDDSAPEHVIGPDGRFTLPLASVARSGRSARAALARIAGKDTFSPEDRETVRQLADSTGAITRCWEIVDTWLRAAQECLMPLPDGEAKELLLQAASDLCGRLLPAAPEGPRPLPAFSMGRMAPVHRAD